jgi:hypothetical protein
VHRNSSLIPTVINATFLVHLEACREKGVLVSYLLKFRYLHLDPMMFTCSLHEMNAYNGVSVRVSAYIICETSKRIPI